MSDPTVETASKLVVALWTRIGLIRGRGLPWQRAEANRLQEAAECIQSLLATHAVARVDIEAMRSHKEKLRRIEAIVTGRSA